MSQTFGGSQVGLNPYLLNIIPLQNIANPEQGAQVDNLSNSVRLFTTMINGTTKTIRTSNILPYTNGGIVNMTGRFNVNGSLNVNGAFTASNIGINNIVNTNAMNLQCGSTAIHLVSSSTTATPANATPAISFITAGNQSFSLDTANRALYKGDGISSNVNSMWVSSAILHADRAAINYGGSNNVSTIFDVWNGDAYFDKSIYVKNVVNCQSVYQFSDARLKSNIENIQNPLDTICKLKGVHYDIQGTPSYGFIAQEVAEIIPQAIRRAHSGLLTLDYSQIIPILVEAVKELNQKISAPK